MKKGIFIKIQKWVKFLLIKQKLILDNSAPPQKTNNKLKETSSIGMI